MRIVIFGLSITSAWGNGHATTFRSIVRGLFARGHEVHFLERDVPWYASHRDFDPPGPPDLGQVVLYDDLAQLSDHYESLVRDADFVIVGSCVPGGEAVGQWVLVTASGITAFYDIDTPVTLAGLREGAIDYLSADLIPRYDLYLSFTGGDVLDELETVWGANRAIALYCCADPDLYYPSEREPQVQLGYLGTYSSDRQPLVEELLFRPARAIPEGRFVLGGPQYPANIDRPANVDHIDHVPPEAHREFYSKQKFTLNLTRADMKRLGYSPSVRLFEAAACGACIISDRWTGIEEVFAPEDEILLADCADEVVHHLSRMDASQRRRIGQRARQRVLTEHTGAHRAMELEKHVRDAVSSPANAPMAE